MESPIPILPLPTPDAETEKLIRMKDEEVCGAVGVAEAGSRDALPRCCSPARLSPPARPPAAEAHAGDAAEDEAADAGPVTLVADTPSVSGTPSHPWTPDRTVPDPETRGHSPQLTLIYSQHHPLPGHSYLLPRGLDCSPRPAGPLWPWGIRSEVGRYFKDPPLLPFPRPQTVTPPKLQALL